MVNTTDTTTRLPKVDLVSGEDITRFCSITGDWNKAHVGPQAAVPAFCLDWIAKRLYDGNTQNLKFAGLYNKFRSVLKLEEPFAIVKGTEEGTNYSFKILKGDKEIVEGLMNYATVLPEPQQTRFDTHADKSKTTTMNYKFRNNLITPLRSIFNIDEISARLVYMVSSSSNALLEAAKTETNPENAEKQPYFGSHRLNVYNGIEEALQNQNLEFLLQVRVDGSKKAQMPAYIRGADNKGKRLFDLTVTIFYFQPQPF